MTRTKDPEEDNLTLLSPITATGGKSVVGVGGEDPYVYFISEAQLLPSEAPGGGIFVWHAGELDFVGGIEISGLEDTEQALSGCCVSILVGFRQSRVSPDGTSLLFATLNGGNKLSRYGGSDHAHDGCFSKGAPIACRELYLYQAESDNLRCISCPPDGKSAVKVLDFEEQTSVYVRRFQGSIHEGLHETRALSADGRYAFFSTSQKLVPEDTNGVNDAYVYDSETGKASLLTTGEDSSPSFFVDASSDGSDVFVATREPLSGWDVGVDYDLYNARLGGGFPEPLPAPPSCQGDACQPGPLDLSDPTPASSGLQGPGDVAARRGSRARCPQGKRRVKARGGRTRCVKKPKRGAQNNRRAGK